MKSVILSIICLLFVSSIAGEEKKSSAAEDSKISSPKKFLVQKIEAVDVEKAAAKSIEEAIVFDIGKRKGYSVVTSAELEQTVQFSEKGMQMGCDESAACLIEIQDKLAVATLIAGKIGKLGDEYILSLNTVDVANSAVGKRSNIQAKSIDEIKKGVHKAIDEMLGLSIPKQPFRLKKGEKLKLAVMPLSERGIEKSTADALTQILSAELNQIEGISVISQDDIKAMLDKAALDAQMACTDSLECVVEIGAALGLSKLVTGSVGKVKDTFVISIQLIDARKADVENRVLESFAGEKGELKNAIKLAAYQIAGVDFESKKGGINFTFNVEDADVQLGEQEGKVTASQFKQKDLIPGRYYLKVIGDQDDYYPLQTDIYVAPGANNVKTFMLLEKAAPWYKSWWFWTVSGTVLAGAALTTYYFSQQIPDAELTIKGQPANQ